MFVVSGKVAIFTGSTRGIGLASAEALAAGGAKVVISGRGQETCDAVAADFRAKGCQAIAIAAHVGHRDQVEHLVQKTVEEWGTVDIMVCNAATSPYYGPTNDTPDDLFDKTMTVNVRSSIWFAAAVTPYMQASGGGSIILLSSITAFIGTEGIAAYAMSKAAESQLSRNLAVELGPQNIRINSIAPSLIKTEFARALWENKKIMCHQENMTPLRRIGQPDDTAGIVLFLSSPAAKFITGQKIVADGGETFSM